MLSFATSTTLYPVAGLIAFTYVQQIYVALKARRLGIAQQLMAAVAWSAKAKGFQRMEWSTSRDNIAARALYEGLGAIGAEKVSYTLTGAELDRLAMTHVDRDLTKQVPGVSRQTIASGYPYEDEYGYSRAVRVGNQVFVSGTTARPPHLDGDAYEQAKAILSIVEEALTQAGAALHHVVRTVVYVVDMNDAPLVARAHAEAFGRVRPASTLVQVAALTPVRPGSKLKQPPSSTGDGGEWNQGSTQMPAYLISNVSVKDGAAFQAYRSRAATSIEQHGGRYLVRGGPIDVLEGSWAPTTIVVVEFPTSNGHGRGTARPSMPQPSRSAMTP